MSEREALTTEAQSFRTGLAVLTDWAERLESGDPGVVLAHITWVALGLAQEAQRMAERVVMVEEGAPPSFLSMDGALFTRTGRAVTLDRTEFTILNGGYRDEW